MSAHDVLCPVEDYSVPYLCLCELIEMVRADERERIAQAIAEREAVASSEYIGTAETYWEGSRDAFDIAEQIARDGGRDDC